MEKHRPFTSNHLGFIPQADFLSPDARSDPGCLFCSATTPLADRRASANINVIGQLAERMEAAPSRARRHITHVLPSCLCHGANDARRGRACGSSVWLLFFYFVSAMS